jgi:siroheme synthase-like protein
VYPIVLRLQGKRCLVVGGGQVALRKVEGLVAAGARVTVVAPEVAERLTRLAHDGVVTVARRAYRADDVAGAWLVFAATDEPAVQQAVFDDAEQAGVWVNAADDPDRCAFFLPAVHRRDPVVVAVSTQGASPALAGWLRDRMAGALPIRLEALVAALREERRALRAAGQSTEGIDWRSRIDALDAALGDEHGP